MFNCDYSITGNTNRSLFFSQNRGMCQIREANIREKLIKIYTVERTNEAEIIRKNRVRKGRVV